MKLSIVLPVWIKNDELLDLTLTTLDSLYQTEVPDGDEVETIFVDNASPIGGDQLMKYAHIYVKGQENRGYPWAVNQGIKVATGDYLVIANNDIKVSPNWWLVAKEIFEKVPKAGSAHFRMLEYDQPNVPDNKMWPTGKEKWCSSSFFIIKKEVFDNIGLYDENYGIFGYDDWDFWYRVRKAGYQTVYTNAAFYQHKDSSTANSLDQEARQASVDKNREYFKEKHGGYPEDLFNNQFPNQVNKPWKPQP